MADLYKILGVERTASADEIKKAYRNLAFKYHPDRNAGDKNAEDKFKEINEAYSVLGDEAKRRQYDMFGSSVNSGYSQSNSTGYAGGGQNFYGEDPFAEFFRNAYRDAENAHRYTYTYTTHNSETPKGKRAFSYLGGSILKVGLSLLGLYIFGRWSFIIAIICLVSLVTGIKDAFRSVKWILSE